MKQGWIVTALALGLAVTLTACGRDSGSTANMTGTAGRTRTTTQGVTAGRAAYDKTHTTQRRTAYDYLNDGRYVAKDDGEVKNGSGSPAARDFTQDARDLMRDTGEAVGDAGKAVGDAVGRLGRGVGDAARDVTGQ